jgi:hypothetical protein
MPGRMAWEKRSDELLLSLIQTNFPPCPNIFPNKPLPCRNFVMEFIIPHDLHEIRKNIILLIV